MLFVWFEAQLAVVDRASILARFELAVWRPSAKALRRWARTEAYNRNNWKKPIMTQWMWQNQPFCLRPELCAQAALESTASQSWSKRILCMHLSRLFILNSKLCFGLGRSRIPLTSINAQKSQVPQPARITLSYGSSSARHSPEGPLAPLATDIS